MKARILFAALATLLGALTFAGLSNGQVTATPVGLTEALRADQTTTQNVTLSNLTDRELSFKVKFSKVDRGQRERGPRRDDPGDVIREINNVGASNFGGMAWDGEIMWGSSYGQNVIIGVDPQQDDQVVTRFNHPGQPLSMAFDGENLWTTTWNGTRITVFNRQGDNVETFNLQFGSHGGMATDANGHILIQSKGDNRVHVINIDDREEVTNFDCRAAMGNADIWGIEWVEAHPDGQLWGMSSQHLWEASVDEDWNCQAVQDFAVRAENAHTEPGHDGENMWHGMWNTQTWYVLDDGVTEVYWLNVDPKEGVIAANGETDLEFTFNSAEMENGVNEFWIDLQFPGNEEYDLRMSAVLTVGDPTASIHGVVTDAATGNAVVGVKASLDVYTFERPSGDNGAYALEHLPPAVYNVTFTCPDYLPTTREVQLGRNGAELNIGLLHAECSLSTDAIDMQLAPDTDTDVDFSVTNGGNGPLTFTSERRLLGDANAAPWEVRRTLNTGAILEDDRIEGVAFDGENFFVSGANGVDSSQIYVINRDGEQVRSFDQLTHTRYGMKDLEYDGETFWGSGEANVIGFNAQGEEVASFRGPFNPTSNIGYDSDEEILWLSGTTTNIIAYDHAGNALNRTLNRKGLRIYGLAYWPDDPDGYNLYILNSPAGGGTFVHKMNTANGDTLLAYTFPAEANVTSGGAFICNTYDVYSWVLMAMQNIPAGDGGDRLSILQLDARKDWMAVEPSEGVIEAGARQGFTLQLNAAGLPAVLFEGEIVFTHDGVGGETHLPVSLDVVEGPVQSVRNIQLALGWNTVSANLQPDEAAFAALTRPLVDAGVLRMIKDDRGHFMSVGGNAFNNLPDWNVAKGYLFKVTQPAVLQLGGMTVMADDVIHLEQGWQMISYYPRRAVNVSVALSGVSDQLQVAKDGYGNFYLPSYGYENIGLMRECQGYQVRMSEAVDLVYRIQNQGRDAVAYQSIQDHPGRYPLHAQTGSNMSLLVEAAGFDGEIGVYAAGELVGTGILDRGRAGVAVWGDDPTTPELDGAVNGDALEVRLMDAGGERALSTTALAGELTYQTDGFAVIRASETSAPETFGLAGVYPNPFNGRTTVRVVTPEAGKLQLALYDLGGRMIREVAAGRYEAGSHNVTIDAGDLASGVYLLRLSAAGKTSQMKVALVK